MGLADKSPHPFPPRDCCFYSSAMAWTSEYGWGAAVRSKDGARWASEPWERNDTSWSESKYEYEDASTPTYEYDDHGKSSKGKHGPKGKAGKGKGDKGKVGRGGKGKGEFYFVDDDDEWMRYAPGMNAPNFLDRSTK